MCVELDPLSHFKRLQMGIFGFSQKETGAESVAMATTGLQMIKNNTITKKIFLDGQLMLMIIIGIIDQFQYIKIQSQTIDLSTRLWGITTEFVGFIPQSLALRSIV